MFNKDLTDVEKLKHLKKLKKTAEVKRAAASTESSDKLSDALSSDMLS